MKRLFLLIVLVMVVSWIMVSHRTAHRVKLDRHQQTRRALAEARHALAEARDEVRQALNEARDDVCEAFGEVRDSLECDIDRPHRPNRAPSPKAVASEHAEGLPVAIVPGSRVTEAKATIPAAALPALAHTPADRTASTTAAVAGQLSATEERAKADAHRRLREEVAEWLSPDVPTDWSQPAQLVDSMVLETRIKPIHKEYGILYQATLTVDKSPQRRSALVDRFHRELIEQRMVTVGGTLAFVLVCLGAVSGYIRADEATKGYYTNRLRMLAAAAVAGAGAILYHMLT
jgi:hypothetical protein